MDRLGCPRQHAQQAQQRPSLAPGGPTASPCLDNGCMAIASPTRHNLVHRGQQLEYFTIAYNSAEGLVSIVAGIVAGSVSLVGFGLDSLIEVTSGAALLWRLHHDLDHSGREQVERTTLRIVGASFIALALYIFYESGSTLIGHQIPERSIPGIIVASVSTKGRDGWRRKSEANPAAVRDKDSGFHFSSTTFGVATSG